MLVVMAVVVATTPTWIEDIENAGKVLGVLIALFTLYAIFEMRQRRVIGIIVTDSVRTETELIRKDIEEVSTRVAWIEGRLGRET